MDREKAIAKIKKCFALSKSSNANEAAAALRQAQKLMQKHGIDESEVSEYSNEAVDVPIQKNKKIPEVLNYLVGIIARAFQVKPVFEDRIGISDISYRVRYFGKVDKVMLAAYAHVVVYRAMESAWREFRNGQGGGQFERGARSSFQIGWLYEVESKIEEFAADGIEESETSLAIARHYGRELKPCSVNEVPINQSLAHVGKRRAKDFNLNRPLGEERIGLEKL